VRLVWDSGAGAVVVDERRRLPGRGAWLHADQACVDLAVRRRAIGRALRRDDVAGSSLFPPDGPKLCAGLPLGQAENSKVGVRS